MKAKNILSIGIVIIIHSSVTAQSIDEMRTPASPGFILMDNTPASIEKPSTPQGLALNILNLGQGGAIEFAPYWLKSHPNLRLSDYLANQAQFPILKNLSVSLTSAKNTDTLNLAIGLRSDVFRYRSSKNIKEIEKVKVSIKAILNEDEPDPEKIGKLKQKFDLAMRPLLLVSLAGAYLGTSPTSSYNDLELSRSGFWVNAAVRPDARRPFELIVLARHLQNPTFGDYENDTKIFDTGTRLLYAFDAMTISAEYILRRVSDSDSFYRLAGILEYKINENAYITGTFGKAFDPKSDILALFGLNIGLSSKTSILK